MPKVSKKTAPPGKKSIASWVIYASYSVQDKNAICLVADPRLGSLVTWKPHRALRFATKAAAVAHCRKMLKDRANSNEPSRYRCLTVLPLTTDEISRSRTPRKRPDHGPQDEDRDLGFPDPGPPGGDERRDDGGP